MRLVEIREKTVPLSRYADPGIPSDGLDTTAVALLTDVYRDGAPIVGFGFSSIGRFGQSGLIRERFAPRLLAAREDALVNAAGDNLDPFRFLGDRVGRRADRAAVPVYAGGGYYFPSEDRRRLSDEIRQFLDQGYTHVKIKIGGRSLKEDLQRIETALALLPGGDRLAVDAMNRYTPEAALQAADALAPYRLRWFEDFCDPLDFETHTQIARAYHPPLAAGEALFSQADARNLIRYGGLRPDRDVLLFDPVHTYGLPEYLRILDLLEGSGWSRASCQPHGGHLFALHVAAALGLGGSESNPHNFQPFGGFSDGAVVSGGAIAPPETPGIGFETRAALRALFPSVGIP